MLICVTSVDVLLKYFQQKIFSTSDFHGSCRHLPSMRSLKFPFFMNSYTSICKSQDSSTRYQQCCNKHQSLDLIKTSWWFLRPGLKFRLNLKVHTNPKLTYTSSAIDARHLQTCITNCEEPCSNKVCIGCSLQPMARWQVSITTGWSGQAMARSSITSDHMPFYRMVTFLSKRNVTFLWWRLYIHHFSATPTYMLCFAITKLANGATRHYDFSRILLAVYSLLDHGYVDTRGKPLTLVKWWATNYVECAMVCGLFVAS